MGDILDKKVCIKNTTKAKSSGKEMLFD